MEIDGKMTSEKWKGDYIGCLHDGKLSEANKIKRDNIPKKLYRFERVADNRIKTLRNNQLYVSHIKGFDDPYDAKGYYWNRDELLKTFDLKQYDVTVDKYLDEIEKQILFWFENCFVGCFTEDINNFPMWYYYADKYQGFCVEYDFSNLTEDDEFQQALKPVVYLERKFDLTNTIKTVFKPENIIADKTDAFYWLHCIGNIIKDESWEFEREWRYITFDDDFMLSGKNVKIPVKPSHIYCGNKMNSKDFDEMRKISNELGCGCSKISIGDNFVKEFVVL